MIVEEQLRYTVKKRGRLFWQPTAEMRALGFQSKPLGADTESARAEAKRLAESWDKARAELDTVTSYPPGSFGAYWDRLRGSKKEPSAWWNPKKARTREDYERGWVYIDAWAPTDADGRPTGPTLSRTVITEITTELCEQFYQHLSGKAGDEDRGIMPVAAAASESERYRAIKAMKILLADAVVRLRLGYASPAAKLVNPQPKGRSQIWLGAEIEDLAAGAAIAGFEGMSLAIEVAWETMFSPVDVRTLRPRQMKTDGLGWYFHRARTKTQVEAFGYVSGALAERILAYVDRQGRVEGDNTPIFRTREFADGPGRPPQAVAYKTKDTFAKDFRMVRAMMFPDDERQLLDIRRSANIEADAAGADKKTMGELLANGLADSKFLDETYTPPTVAKAREVAEQRIQGRAKLAGEVMRTRNR